MSKSKKRKNRPPRIVGTNAGSPDVRSLAAVKALAHKSRAHQMLVQRILRQLHELSNRVSASLKYHAQDRVRMLASLLVIGTLVLYTAACDETSGDTSPPGDAVVTQTEELQAEVADGLPAEKGKVYPVKSDTIYRDHRGVYYLQWSQEPNSDQWNPASVSRLRIAESTTGRTELNMVNDGDPILMMPADTPVFLTWPRTEAEANETPTPGGTPTPTPTSGDRHYYAGSVFPYPIFFPYGYYRAPWYTMGSGTTVDPTARTPAYRDPPDGSTLAGNQPLRGSVASQTPKPFSDRSVSSVAVSGKSSGTGVGQAVTGRSGSAISGQRGGTGSGVAATGKSSGGSGVSAPSSSSFSGGKAGSSGGSSSSSS